jgi:predicted site-specific integrase-resolvase
MRNADLIGSAEACEILGIDRATLVRWIAASKIAKVTKMPGQTGAYVFERAEIERAAAEQPKATAAPAP